MCESFLYYLTSHPHTEVGDPRIVDWLLDCVGHPEYEVREGEGGRERFTSTRHIQVVDITLNFWYRLSEELMKLDCRETTAVFKPYITKLISHLCVHCRLDEDTSVVGVAWGVTCTVVLPPLLQDTVPSERDEFGGFRMSVREVIRDVIFIVGSLNCFADVCSRENSTVN